jgi:uncharacterized protein (UPF0297 family)
MTAVSGVSIIARYDGETVTTITDENGIAHYTKLPKNTDVYIQLIKSGYHPINIVIRNMVSVSPTAVRITLTDIDTGQILHTEIIQILPDLEVPFDYQIEGYQRIAGSITVRQT